MTKRVQRYVEAVPEGDREKRHQRHQHSGLTSCHGAHEQNHRQVRAEETKQLKANGLESVLTNSRFILLKRPENLTDKQEIKLADLVQYNLRSIRAYLLKEDFQQFWEYLSPYYAGKFLDAWCTRTMRSKIEPMKKIAKILRKHRSLLMNWFKAKDELSSGVVERFNNKAKLTMKKS